MSGNKKTMTTFIRLMILIVLLLNVGLTAVYAESSVSKSTEYVEKFDAMLDSSEQFRTMLVLGVIAMFVIFIFIMKKSPLYGAKFGFVLVGLIFLFLSAREKVYFEKGKAAVATITDVEVSCHLETVYDDEGDMDYESETTAIETFKYTVDGKEYTGKQKKSVSHGADDKGGRVQATMDQKFAAKEKAKIGTTFTLHYMPDNPSDYTVADENTPKKYSIIGIVLIAVGLFIIRRWKKPGRLARNTGVGMQPQNMNGMMGAGGMTQQQYMQQQPQNMGGYGVFQCPYCGTQLAAGTRFCTGCGSQLY